MVTREAQYLIAIIAIMLLMSGITATGTPDTSIHASAPPQTTPAFGQLEPSTNDDLQSALLIPGAVEHPIPRMGDQKLLVALVDFPDKPGLFTGQDWYEFFFGAEGFDAYFREASYNQLRYTGDIVGMVGSTPVTNSTMTAYVRLTNPISYYANGMYGYDVSPGAFPRNHGGVVMHALQALDSAGFDFAPYADPATNQVYNLVVIFAGSTYRYTQDPNNSLEATAYRLFWAGGGTYASSGGQLFDDYTFCPDQRFNQSGLIAYVGVCAHEHGHALGMSDLYDFSYTTSGAGNFDIMAYGAFGATAGQRPFHFGAFSKEFFGWMTPTVAAPETNTYLIGPSETEASFLRLYPNGNTSSPEYFLLENRQPIGFDQDWSSANLCPGLVIWHVDQNIVQNYPYLVNTLASAGGPPHQGVIVVEADGGSDMITPPVNYGECGDTWTVGQTWNANSTPNSNLWDGSLSNLAVTVTGMCSNDALQLSVTVDGTTTVHQAPAGLEGGSTLLLPLVMKNSC
jgi:immune inhibitor A